MARPKRQWATVRILESRLLQLKAESELSNRPVADVLDEILGLREAELAMVESAVDATAECA